MATRKRASKKSKKVTVDFKWDVGGNSNNKSLQKTKKQLKKLSFGAIVVAVLFLIVGVAGGFVSMKIMMNNDCFELVGKDEITLQIGESYMDEGAKVVAFGKDATNKIKIETNLTKNEDGTYTSNEIGTFYMTYTVNNFKYGTIFKIQKIRLITFVEEAEQDEIDSANEGGNS